MSAVLKSRQWGWYYYLNDTIDLTLSLSCLRIVIVPRSAASIVFPVMLFGGAKAYVGKRNTKRKNKICIFFCEAPRM
jgi:hypothetical protein